ncbi:unnamed protein product, partial [Ectocarpus sp. 12 AP-2014]
LSYTSSCCGFALRPSLTRKRNERPGACNIPGTCNSSRTKAPPGACLLRYGRLLCKVYGILCHNKCFHTFHTRRGPGKGHSGLHRGDLSNIHPNAPDAADLFQTNCVLSAA